MKHLTDIVAAFSRGIARSRVSLVGAMIVTVIFPFLAGAIFYDSVWHIANTYFSAAIYMLLGPAFAGGLVLVFLGLFFFKGKEEVRLFTLEYLRGYFADPTKFTKMRRLVFFAVFLTCINIAIFALLGYRSYHYMESVSFCGEFCHVVMSPEKTAYSNSPHSRVACVECHIGSGATWFVKSKISGARQLFAVALDTFPRPIEVPVHGLRPARDTCEECHRPEKFVGEKLVVKDKFLEDENNTHVQTVLLMKVGSAGDRAVSSHGIHWHIAPENKILYKAVDDKRLDIPEVTLIGNGVTEHVFRTEDADEKLKEAENVEVREMDCIDCHNRPTHIYLPADTALNNKMMKGAVPAELPFVKKVAMELVQKEYASHDAAKAAIAEGMRSYYQANYAELVAGKPELLEKAIAGVQAAYVENVFPEMNIGWGTYTDQRGHDKDFAENFGCFRCHDDMHSTEDGESISQDCDTCHTVLAQEEENPEILQTLGIH